MTEHSMADQAAADSPRPDVNSHFGIIGDHGFAWMIPPEFRGLDIYVYALNNLPGTNPLLPGSPKKCSAPPSVPDDPVVRILSHQAVQKKDGIWMMGAANDTANQWCWESEIVVHYGRQRFDYEFPSKHNRPDRYEPAFALPNWPRSHDGGRSSTHFNGPAVVSGPSFPIDFSHPDFGLWVPHGIRGHAED